MVFTCFLAIARQREGFDMVPASRAPAFPSVVRARQTLLARLKHIGLSHHQAEDIAQEALLAWWTKHPCLSRRSAHNNRRRFVS